MANPILPKSLSMKCHSHHLLPCREAIHPDTAATTANIHPNGRLPIMNGDTTNPPRSRMDVIPNFVERSIPAMLSGWQHYRKT
jgi:hypothetical protein